MASPIKSALSPYYTGTQRRDPQKSQTPKPKAVSATPICTHQLKPETRCDQAALRNMMKRVLANSLSPDLQYEMCDSGALTQSLADELRIAAKLVLPERYKVIVIVNIFEKKNLSCYLSSQCIWSKQCDVFLQENFQNSSLQVCACLYVVYKE